MNKLLMTASIATGLALALQTLTPIGVAHAATDVEKVGLKSLAADLDGTKNHRVVIDTSGDIPDSVGLTMVSTSSEGDDVEFDITSPHSGAVLTSGTLDLLIQPEGGTATLVILGLGDGLAVGDEFEVVLPLDPEEGGETDVVFSEGEGLITASLTPVEGEVDTYHVLLTLDFEITGDIGGFEYFDVTVQETDGDVSVIDEQAELNIDGSDLRWRSDFTTTETTLTSVWYEASVSVTSGGVETEEDAFSTSIADADESDVFGVSSLTVFVRSKARSGGDFKLVTKQLVSVPDDEVLSSSYTLSTEDGTEVASITPVVNRTASKFFIEDLNFAQSAVGYTVTLDVDMLNSDDEVVAVQTLDVVVRASDTSKVDTTSATEDAYIWGLSARELEDGSVGVSLAIFGELAEDVVAINLDVTTTDGPELTGSTSFYGERVGRLVEFRGVAIVDTDYADESLNFVTELTDSSGETVETMEGTTGQTAQRRYRRMRRAMKTDMANCRCPRY